MYNLSFSTILGLFVFIARSINVLPFTNISVFAPSKISGRIKSGNWYATAIERGELPSEST